jgi:tetratricopeptide (TPR) repeat protein
MKVLLELLGDACQLLSGLESLGELRPDSRERVQALVHQLQFETTRLLEAPVEDSAKSRRDRALQRGLEALAREEFERAREVFEKSLEEFPGDDEFAGYLGLIAWEQGDIEAAERAYRHAASLVFPDGIESARPVMERYAPGLRSVEGQALCLYRMGRLEEAVTLFEALARKEPADYVGCHYLAGEIYHNLGQLDLALAHYRLVPVEPAVLYMLGLAHFQRDELELCAGHLIRAFVSNVHVACFLLGRFGYHRSCMPGYLGSEAYAEEFVEACAPLWQSAQGAFTFLGRCFDHALVQSHLQQCADRGGEQLISFGDGASEQEGWLEQVQDAGYLKSLVERVLQRLDS